MEGGREKMRKEKEIIDAWINGNRAWVREEMKNKSKIFAIDVIITLTSDYGYHHHQAIWTVRSMCDDLNCFEKLELEAEAVGVLP